MTEALYALALLACPVGMGAMMWMMMRGNNKSSSSDTAAKQAELASLQAQLDYLEAEQRDTDQAASERG
jgi:hypothetical protein